MSWSITLNGHHDDPTVEAKAKELGERFAAEVKAADVGLTYANFSSSTLTGSILPAEEPLPGS